MPVKTFSSSEMVFSVIWATFGFVACDCGYDGFFVFLEQLFCEGFDMFFFTFLCLACGFNQAVCDACRAETTTATLQSFLAYLVTDSAT
jgi:hypothetical protein